MGKIANPHELVSEIRKLMEAAKSDSNPSRQELAANLRTLASRVGGVHPALESELRIFLRTAKKFADAALDLTRAWEDVEDVEATISSKYPFREDFRQVANDIHSWYLDVEDEVKAELR